MKGGQVREAMNEVKPVLQALLIADHIYQDIATGKVVIAGIFSRLYFSKAQPQEGDPTPQPVQSAQRVGSPYAYISLTDIRGKTSFKLRYVNLDNYEVSMETTFDVESDDPLKTAEVVMPMPMLPTGKKGTFALELLWDDSLLGALRIIVDELPGGP